jgi:uncharacterized protein (TIGR03067 family)
MLTTTALFLAVSAATAAPAPNADAKNDKLEGTWVASSYIDHGEKIKDEDARKIQLILKGGKYTLMADGQIMDQGSYTFDPSKKPAHLDTTSSVGDMKGVGDHGIYELKGDTLKTAFDEITKQQRPTSFDGKKYQVVEFARQKK